MELHHGEFTCYQDGETPEYASGGFAMERDRVSFSVEPLDPAIPSVLYRRDVGGATVLLNEKELRQFESSKRLSTFFVLFPRTSANFDLKWIDLVRSHPHFANALPTWELKDHDFSWRTYQGKRLNALLAEHPDFEKHLPEQLWQTLHPD